MDIEQQREDFKKLTHDENRWRWVFEINKRQEELNEEKTLYILLDNDMTYLKIGFDDESDCFAFDESIGYSPGLRSLFKQFRLNSGLV